MPRLAEARNGDSTKEYFKANMRAMRDSKRSWWRRLLHIEPGVALGQWVVDRINNNWQWLLVFFGGGSMSYLASFSQWVSQFGAIGWVLCGLIGAVIVLIVLVLFQVWQRARINNRFYRRLAEQPDAVNPLDRTFESKRVRLSELAPPAGWEIKGKTFIACEVVGPANVLLMTGNSITRMRSVFVDAILLSETGNPTNGYLVNDCTFTDCTFYNISFFVLPSQFKDFALGMVNVNWITEIPRHLVAQVLTPDQMKEWEDKRRQQSSRDELPAPQLPLEKPGRTRR